MLETPKLWWYWKEKPFRLCPSRRSWFWVTVQQFTALETGHVMYIYVYLGMYWQQNDIDLATWMSNSAPAVGGSTAQVGSLMFTSSLQTFLINGHHQSPLCSASVQITPIQNSSSYLIKFRTPGWVAVDIGQTPSRESSHYQRANVRAEGHHPSSCEKPPTMRPNPTSMW